MAVEGYPESHCGAIRGQQSKSAFRNRLGIAYRDQLHAEFMPLETIIPMAQTFYHPDYPATRCENVYAVIGKFLKTPRSQSTSRRLKRKWYTGEHPRTTRP